jgi:rSAM/selenodomain-associated transferase 2
VDVPRLAIVVPALDEEAVIGTHLPAALREADEVVVSDGGSGDRTREIAAALGAKVVCGPPGRGAQLNRGAAATGAGALLFLHADTTLPPGARDRVLGALAAGHVGGAFAVRFAPETALLRLGGRLASARSRLTGLALGDQAQFASRAAFAALGGYREWPLLEDLDFAWRLRRHGRTAQLEVPVVTSSRRFLQRGVLRTVATNWLIWGLYSAGVSPQRLARLYTQLPLRDLTR